jgi:hypothetical protein
MLRNGSVCFDDNTHHVIARKERSEGRGNPLHAMGAYGECGSLTDSQWIATGFRPRDDKVVAWCVVFVIARKERSDRRGNPLGAMGAYGQCGTLPDSQWIATGYALAMTMQLMFANLLCIAN